MPIPEDEMQIFLEMNVEALQLPKADIESAMMLAQDFRDNLPGLDPVTVGRVVMGAAMALQVVRDTLEEDTEQHDMVIHIGVRILSRIGNRFIVAALDLAREEWEQELTK